MASKHLTLLTVVFMHLQLRQGHVRPIPEFLGARQSASATAREAANVGQPPHAQLLAEYLVML